MSETADGTWNFKKEWIGEFEDARSVGVGDYGYGHWIAMTRSRNCVSGFEL